MYMYYIHLKRQRCEIPGWLSNIVAKKATYVVNLLPETARQINKLLTFQHVSDNAEGTSSYLTLKFKVIVQVHVLVKVIIDCIKNFDKEKIKLGFSLNVK